MSATHRLLRFGVFELNLDLEELRKEGLPIKLGPQPFKVLAMLAARSGQLVLRDQIRDEIWGSETYVDFEHGLNQCIKQIRTALNDSTSRPLYVETIPRKGYRFLAPVTSKTITITPKVTLSTSGVQPLILLPGGTPKPAHPVVAAIPNGTATAPELALDPAEEEPAPSVAAHVGKPVPMAPVKRISRSLVVGIALLAFIAATAIGFYWRSRNTKALTEKDTLVIADFANKTGDPVFDDTLRTAVTLALNQSPFLNVLPDRKLRETLDLMRRPADSRLSPEIAREVGQRAGSKAYVSGSIANLGKEYVFELKAVSCQSGDVLAEEQVTAANKEQVLNAVGKAATQLRTQLGETLATVQKFDVPLAQATTSSLEALQAYSLGTKARATKGPAAALPSFERALQLDPNFATAYAEIGGIYDHLAESGRASEYIAKAFPLREHASDREKLFITRSYYMNVTGELDKAERTDLEMIENYPGHASEYKNLGIIYSIKGRYDKAIEAVRQAIALDPNQVTAYGDLTNVLLAAQRPDEARQAIAEAHERKLDDSLLHLGSYALAFIASDQAGMAEQRQWLANTPGFAHFGLALASDTAAYSGQLAEATDLSKQAVASALQVQSPENAALWWENAALRDAAFGKSPEAQKAAAAGLKLDPGSKGVQVEAALAYAMLGDNTRAESLVKALDERYPVDTQVQSLWIPAVRAQLALNRHNTAEAIERLQLALPPIEFGQIPFAANISCLYPTYIRGQAYLAAGQGSAAAAEFKKIIDHGGIVWNCWTGALARLGLARANAMQARVVGKEADAERARASEDYRSFLSLWNRADADIPVYQQARADYGKLR